MIELVSSLASSVGRDMDILERKFAKGEISKKEYTERKRELKK